MKIIIVKQLPSSIFLHIPIPSIKNPSPNSEKKFKKTCQRKSPKNFLPGGKEKVVKIDLYVHDLRVGSPNPTVYEVARASVTADSPAEFGVVDDLITSGPDISSKAVGRIQGLTTAADMTAHTALLNLTINFTTGRFNGSTISILGRNQVMEERRELAVGGGTGAFRFARGYAIQSTTSYDAVTSYGVYKYSIYTTCNSKFSESDDVEVAEV